MNSLIYCKNINGLDYVFSVDYVVNSFGAPRCWEHDETSFKYKITGATGALDTGSDSILMPVSEAILDILEDDEALAEEIEADAFERKLADEDARNEAIEASQFGMGA